MVTYPFLPDAWSLRLEQVSVAGGEALLVATSARPTGTCPSCGQPAARVHSHYTRTLQDLSWQGIRVTIHWRSRKFFCETAGCPTRIFTEQLPLVTCRHGRRTARARDVLECLGLTLGGEAGCRVAHLLQLPVSADTLLRTVRRIVLPPFAEPRVIGVDDWALRRGQRYGTLIVDLERHQALDLLPTRQWEALRDWLHAHSGVEVVSRDRADGYVRGATSGAPEAVQVADRWHLLKNLREALRTCAERFGAEIRQAAQDTPKIVAPSPTASVNPPSETPGPNPPVKKKADSPRELRCARRRERYQRVQELSAQGLSQRAISQATGLDRKTVRRFLHAKEFPERATSPRFGQTTPFLADLQRLWNEGCHNARILTRKIIELGYRGTYDSVRRRVAKWRRNLSPHGADAPSTRPLKSAKADIPSANRTAWILFLDPQELDLDERRLAEALQEQCPPLRVAAQLAREFVQFVKLRRVDDLEDWLRRASDDGVPAEIRNFAQGLRAELPSIDAAIRLPWSNGQAEGQINRLKLVKRQMYGRANFDLLKLRFLLGQTAA